MVVRADASGVVVVTSSKNGPAEAISVVVWSVMAVKGRPGHRRHGLDRHLVDAGEAGRPKEVGDPDIIGSLLACEHSGNVVYCHLGIVEVEVVLEAVQLSVSLGGSNLQLQIGPCL
jgi:hypothetical protein